MALRVILARLARAAGEGAPWEPSSGDAAARATAIRRAGHAAANARYRGAVRPAVLAWKALAWPVVSGIGAIRAARWQGQGPRRALAIWRMALSAGVPPLEQHVYRIPPGQSDEAARWLFHNEFMHLNTRLAGRAAVAFCADKAGFAAHLERLGLPSVPTLARIEPGGQAVLPAGEDALVIKPNVGSGAEAVEFWVRGDGGSGTTWLRRDTEPARADDAGLAARIGALAARHGEMLVQPFIPSHDAMRREGRMIGAHLRVISAGFPDGRVEVVHAHVGHGFDEVGAARPQGIGVVDLASGRIVATGAQMDPVFAWMAPPAMARDGVIVPFWPETLDMVARAHRALPHRVPALAWDVTLAPDGPRLIEANVGFSLYFPQLLTRVPGTETPLGAALEAWLREERGEC